MIKKPLLIKISGEIFNNQSLLHHVIEQIKQLTEQHNIGLVIGGGNFFRASKEGKAYGMSQSNADAVGMLATIMNGIILGDLFNAHGVQTNLLSAFAVPSIAQPIQPSTIADAFNTNKCIIFVGGTGNPFFTTDTNAILRALQINAKEVWKATKVDYIYDKDPMEHKNSKPYKTLSYRLFLEQDLKIMDATAITLAQEYRIPIRVFNIFTENALINAAHNGDFGSTIQ
jgi:uridylate kinase